jgi:hypothetical protein
VIPHVVLVFDVSPLLREKFFADACVVLPATESTATKSTRKHNAKIHTKNLPTAHTQKRASKLSLSSFHSLEAAKGASLIAK